MTHNPSRSSEPTASAGADFALHAWVDESMHPPGDHAGVAYPGMYVLASVVADPTCCDGPRDQLSELVAKGQQRLHWTHEPEPQRRKIVAAIASCDMAHLVVVGVETTTRVKEERARAKCMSQLLPRLEEIGVSQVWLESRTHSLNQRDMRLIDRLRGQKQISRGIRVDIELPSAEPMLWVPDAVAGAVAAARKGTVAEHRDALRGMLEEHEFSLG